MAGFPCWLSMQRVAWSELSGRARKGRSVSNDLLGFMAIFLKIKSSWSFSLLYPPPNLSAFKTFKITFVDVAL